MTANGGAKTFTLTDNDVSNCSTEITVSPPANCADVVQPDLTISDLQLQNTSPQVGQSVNYSYDPSNVGGQQSGSFAVRTFVSTDNSLSNNDISVGLVPYANMLAGSTFQDQTFDFTVPSSLTPGNYFLIVKMDANDDVTESNENNNVATIAFTVTGNTGGNLPDLTISDLKLQNTSVQVGQSVSYSYDPSNAGGQQSGSFAVRTYVSTDNLLSNNDISVGLVPYANMLAGSTFQDQTFDFTVPSSLTPGNYFLIVKMDANEAVTENNENNNVATAAFTVTTGGGGTGQIDLALTLEQSVATPNQWSNYSVKATISNSGQQAATGVKISFKKPNGVVYTGGNEWDASQGSFAAFGSEEWAVGSIPAGGSATLTVNYFLLQSTAPVAYAQVTAANESDPDSTPNNGTPPTPSEDDEASTASGGGGGNLADLQITTANSNTNAPAPGDQLLLNYTIKNNGNAGASGFEVRYLLSTDNQVSASDVSIGSTAYTTPLGAGQSSSNTDPFVTIPTGTPIGNYFVLVVADYDGQVAESNENNNVFSFAITVTDFTGLPDLQILSITTLNTDPLTPGGQMPLRYELKNGGTAFVSDFEIGFFCPQTTS